MTNRSVPETASGPLDRTAMSRRPHPIACQVRLRWRRLSVVDAYVLHRKAIFVTTVTMSHRYCRYYDGGKHTHQPRRKPSLSPRTPSTPSTPTSPSSSRPPHAAQPFAASRQASSSQLPSSASSWPWPTGEVPCDSTGLQRFVLLLIDHKPQNNRHHVTHVAKRHRRAGLLPRLSHHTERDSTIRFRLDNVRMILQRTASTSCHR